MDRLLKLLKEQRFPVKDDREEIKKINSVKGLIDLLIFLPKLSKVVEIGSFRGISTEVFLLHAENVIAIDPWFDMGFAYIEFMDRVGSFTNLTVLRSNSQNVLDMVQEESCDLVYIDACHKYESVKRDINNWLPKVKKSKWIAGHDYSNLIENGGVIKAVNEIFGKPDQVFEDSSWIVQVGS